MPNQPRALFEIRNFPAFLEKSLGRKVMRYHLSPLTKPGDNYGSVMQSVEVEVSGHHSSSDCVHNETIHLVCKTTITNPYLVEMFQPSLTFVKEAHFYSDIIPALEYFQQISNVPKYQRIDMFIRCLGSRLSLNPSADYADVDAVLLLENIKSLNYVNEDRQIGFDSEATLAILKTLALFHALCIAMRRQQPDLFNKKVVPYLKAVDLNPDPDFIGGICNELKFVDSLDNQRRTTIEKQLKVCDLSSKRLERIRDTPYTTIVHGDLWTNNIMIKRDGNESGSIKVKLYDFQLYFYESFVHDLLHFLFTSVRETDLMNSFSTFIRFYHQKFFEVMKLVKCPCEEYTFDKMWEEIQTKGKFVLLQSIFMAKIAMTDKKSTKISLDDVTSDTFISEGPPSKAVLQRWKCIFDIYGRNGFI